MTEIKPHKLKGNMHIAHDIQGYMAINTTAPLLWLVLGLVHEITGDQQPFECKFLVNVTRSRGIFHEN